MIDYKTQDKFDKLYNETHRDILKYIVLNCYNLEDAKDILQSTYLEVYKKIDVVNDKKYIVGIAKNKIKRFYRFEYKITVQYKVRNPFPSMSMVGQSTSPLMRKEAKHDVLCLPFTDIRSEEPGMEKGDRLRE